MRIETLGHAIALLSDADGVPLLASDPWVTGSTYWRSWWLENYPRPDDLARLAACRWIYLTHEHPDHLHPPSLRRIAPVAADGPEILLPDFLELKMADYLAGQGWRVRRLPAGQWVALRDDVRVMSLPTWNNDSILLMDTPEALLVNLNDAKPGRAVLDRISALRSALGKRCVLLRSYSPAGPSNNYFRDGQRLPSGKGRYLKAVKAACQRIGADDFIPFASQVVFRRPDTDWANDFKVRYRDLAQAWRRVTHTRLLPPYSRIDLADGSVQSQAPETFDPGVTDRTSRAVAEQAEANGAARWLPEDHQRLTGQLHSLRWPLRLWFPRGFGIRADGVALFWNSRSARLESGAGQGHFTLRLPLLPLKEAVTYGHMGDLCIPMFTDIDLHASTTPDQVDRFFMLLILRDYGYLGTWRRTIRWAGWAIAQRLAARRALPLPG